MTTEEILTQIESETIIHNIPSYRMDSFEKHIKALNKKAAKYGLEPLTYEVGTPYTEPMRFEYTEEVDNYGSKVYWRDIMFYPVLVTNSYNVRINGWEFVGKLEFVDGIYLPSAMPNKEIPMRYLTGEQKDSCLCEHCNTARYRSKTYIVMNEQGEYKKVGSNCLKDFMGHKSAEKLAYLMTLPAMALPEPSEDGWYGGGRSGIDVSPLTLITDISAISGKGQFFITAKSARENDKEATAWRLKAIYEKLQANLYNPKKYPLTDADIINVTEEDKEYAAKVIEYCKSLEGTNNYEYSLKAIAEASHVPDDKIGLFGSAVIAYNRFIETADDREAKLAERAAREAKKAELTYIGEVGDKLELTVKVVNITGFNTDYGYTTVYRFETEEGNIVTWFASNGITTEKGETIKIKGTVKKQDEYKGEKQTVLTRVKKI